MRAKGGGEEERRKKWREGNKKGGRKEGMTGRKKKSGDSRTQLPGFNSGPTTYELDHLEYDK